MTLHTNCGKRCVQKAGAGLKYLISFGKPMQAQFLGKPDQRRGHCLPGLADRLSSAACWYSATLCCQDLCITRSTQILWKRLWARTLIHIKVFEFKQDLLLALFLSTPCQPWICIAGHWTMWRRCQGVHINCGKRCEQGCEVPPKSLIA